MPSTPAIFETDQRQAMRVTCVEHFRSERTRRVLESIVLSSYRALAPRAVTKGAADQNERSHLEGQMPSKRREIT